MARKEIDVGICKLSELFEYNLKYKIPLYQRDYDWENDQCEEFWSDLITHFNSGIRSPYFFGTIMVVNESEKDDLYTVVDGQQRLTTSLILLIAFRDYFLEKGLTDEVDELNKIIYTEDEHEDRIELNVYNKDFFTTKIMEEIKLTEKLTALKLNNDIRKKNKKLKDCYFLLAEEIQKFERVNENRDNILIKLYQHFLRYFSVVENIISDLRKAYRIFESINHKGLALDQNDLVKNYLMETIHLDSKGFSQEKIEEQIIDADNSWQNIVMILEQIKVKEDKFLRYYLMAFIKPTAKEEIYDTIKNEYDNKEKVQELLKKLEQRVRNLSAIVKPTLEEWSNDQDTVDNLLALKSLSDGGMYPILLLAKEKFQFPQMKRLIMLTTKLFFRAKTVCGVNYSEIESLVAKICKMVRDDPETTVEDIQKEMIKWSKYPTVEEFEVLFKKLELPAAKARYPLIELQYEMIGGRHTASSSISDKSEIEHIMPQKITPGSEWEQYIINEKHKTTRLSITEYHQDNVNKLGNMTLLNKSRNRSLANSSFAIKKSNYLTDDLKITKLVSEQPIWDDSTISNRQEYFLNFAKKIWDLKSA